MENLHLELSTITQSNLKRRIYKELKFINNEFLDLSAGISISKDDLNGYKICFYNKKDYKYYYELLIPLDYPFRPPKLTINTKPYFTYCYTENIEFKKALQKYKGCYCLCCETILCGNNWGPQITFKTIFDEVENFKEIVREITHRVIIDVIKRKYLIDDINIVEWLY